MPITLEVSQEAFDLERIRSYLRELRFWTVEETEKELGLKAEGIVYGFHLAWLTGAITAHTPSDPEIAALWKNIYAYTKTMWNEFIEPRGPLTEGEWERIEAENEKMLDTKLCITADAALHLGVSVATFSKIRKVHGLEPAEKVVTSAGYIAHKYLLRDLESLRPFFYSRATKSSDP